MPREILDDDEKPSRSTQARIHHVERSKLLAEVIGLHSWDATIRVGDDLFHFRLWAPHKMIAVDRLPKGIALDDPAVVKRAAN